MTSANTTRQGLVCCLIERLDVIQTVLEKVFILEAKVKSVSLYCD